MPQLKRGPKPPADLTPLPFVSDKVGAERFAEFCARYLIVPKGEGVNEPMVLRGWQVDMLRPFLDPDPRPVIGAIMAPRGLGKTAILAALGLYELFTGPDGNEIPIVAVDENMAGRLLLPAAQMVELHPELASRAVVYKERIELPGSRSKLTAYPAEAKRIEGLGTWTIALADELGEIDADTWSTLLLGAGKLRGAMALGIGTPPNREKSVLMDLRSYAQSYPNDDSRAFVEFSAAGFENHPVDCIHCLELANPQLDDFLDRRAAFALLSEGEDEYRRKRLCQPIVNNENPFVDGDTWDGLASGRGIERGAAVVIGVDGAFGGRDSDAAALIIGTVSATPHFDTLAVYENPGDPNWRVPLLDLENEIRKACRTYNVREVVFDPFRMPQTMQTMESEGIRVSEMPWTAKRITPATIALRSAITNGQLTHSGDEVLTRHVKAAAVRVESNGNVMLAKQSRRRSAAKIDCAAALLMAHSRATWLASRKPTKPLFLGV